MLDEPCDETGSCRSEHLRDGHVSVGDTDAETTSLSGLLKA